MHCLNAYMWHMSNYIEIMRGMYASVNWVIIVSGYDLSHMRRHGIIWTSDD